MSKTYFFFLALILQHIWVYGQFEPVQTLSVQQQLYNPSFFGLNARSQAGITYNKIKISDTDIVNTRYAFGSYSFDEQSFSLGLDFRTFENGSLGLNTNFTRLSFVYQLPINSNWYLLPSLSVDYTHFSLQSADLILEDQINILNGFIASRSIDPLVNTDQLNQNYFTISSGMLLHNDRYLFGLSIHQLNRPNVSFSTGTFEKIPMRIVLQSIGEWPLNSGRLAYLSDENYFRLYTLFSREDSNNYARLGEVLQVGGFHLGLTQSFVSSDQFRLTTYGLNMGLRIENILLEVQYNLPRNVSNKAFSPSLFELSAAFDFLTNRRRTQWNINKAIDTKGY